MMQTQRLEQEQLMYQMTEKKKSKEPVFFNRRTIENAYLTTKP